MKTHLILNFNSILNPPFGEFQGLKNKVEKKSKYLYKSFDISLFSPHQKTLEFHVKKLKDLWPKLKLGVSYLLQFYFFNKKGIKKSWLSA